MKNLEEFEVLDVLDIENEHSDIRFDLRLDPNIYQPYS